MGITSGLNPTQYQKEKERRTLATMAEHIRNALASAKKKSGTDIDEFIKNFAPKCATLVLSVSGEGERDGRASHDRGHRADEGAERRVASSESGERDEDGGLRARISGLSVGRVE